MELEGHPTADIVEELKRRGARAVRGTPSGPNLEKPGPSEKPDDPGLWLFLPKQAYETGLDEEFAAD